MEFRRVSEFKEEFLLKTFLIGCNFAQQLILAFLGDLNLRKKTTKMQLGI